MSFSVETGTQVLHWIRGVVRGLLAERVGSVVWFIETIRINFFLASVSLPVIFLGIGEK